MATDTAEIQKENHQKSESAAPLKLTDDAIRQIKSILEREKLAGHGLRVTVVGGGCSGFSYKLDFDQEEKPGDTVLDMDGLKVYADELSVQYLEGTVIDYVSGLYGAGFKFTNPNASGTCGCGTSFSA